MPANLGPGGGDTAANRFSHNQLVFAAHLIGGTGLSGRVIMGWMAAEEPPGAVSGYRGTQDWLNVGITDSGPLGASNTVWQDPAAAGDFTARWLKGEVVDPGFGRASSGIQSIARTAGQADSVQISAIQRSGWASSGYPNLASLVAQYGQYAPGGVGGSSSGGTAGLGGTGTLGNDYGSAGTFTVGNTSNPNEDYWSAANRLAMGRYWYFFSDGETIYLADGPTLMKQTPAAIIDRFANLPQINHLEFTWDNTAWTYAATHKRRHHAQRRSTLAKIQSPVEARLNLICDIDMVRAGDVVMMTGMGPGDGRWLVGECRRSVFSVYSEITLVPALAPFTEAQIAGVGQSQSGLLPGAAGAGSGTVIGAMISKASTINNQVLPYVWGGGHSHPGFPSGGGYDCSGCVGSVLVSGGLWTSSTLPDNFYIITGLEQHGFLQPGQGSGVPECTLFSSGHSHIFMRLNGVYFGTSDGFGGTSNKALPSNITGPAGGRGGGGGSWLTRGPDVGTFQAYHVPNNILGQATGSVKPN